MPLHEVSSSLSEAGRELVVAESTSSVTITATSEATPTDVISLGAFYYEAVPTLLEFWCSNVSLDDATGGGVGLLCLWDTDSTEIARWADFRTENVAAATKQDVPVFLRYRFTPSAGYNTYKVRGLKSAGVDTFVVTGGTREGSGTYTPIQMRAVRA